MAFGHFGIFNTDFRFCLLFFFTWSSPGGGSDVTDHFLLPAKTKQTLVGKQYLLRTARLYTVYFCSLPLSSLYFAVTAIIHALKIHQASTVNPALGPRPLGITYRKGLFSAFGFKTSCCRKTWKKTKIVHEQNLCQHLFYLTKPRKSA